MLSTIILAIIILVMLTIFYIITGILIIIQELNNPTPRMIEKESFRFKDITQTQTAFEEMVK